MHEWMRSPDTMQSVEPAIVMLEDERWRTAFGRWLWQYFDLSRSPKAGGGHLLVAIPAVFDGTLPSDKGEELLSLLSDDAAPSTRLGPAPIQGRPDYRERGNTVDSR
jgi:hypothetical protein